MSARREVRILSSPRELFQAGAEEFARRSVAAVQATGRCSVALSGGSTPRGLYAQLASGAFPSIPWDKICFFWGDERHVPPGNAESNYRMAYEAMLSKVPVPADNIFRVPAEEKEAGVAAAAYEQTLQTFFHLQNRQLPRFDLVLLGMGQDGHTASLFPGTAALGETRRLVVANWVEKFKTYRITFTLPVLNRAACIVFLASGAEKAAVLHEVLEGSSSAEPLPAGLVHPTDGNLLWLVDRAAASALSVSH